MVTFTQDYIPTPLEQKEKIPADGGVEIVAEIDDRIREGLRQSSGWLQQAQTSMRYYKSDQFQQRVSRRDKNRIRLVTNVIRRDVDLIAAEIYDSKPVVNPVGRHPRYYQLGRQLMQVLDWTRDEEENWESDLERTITFCIHVGEGILFEGWDQEADQGRGLPVTLAIDPRYVFWDDTCQELQRDDSSYVIWISYEPIHKIEAQYPQLQGQIQPETHEAFLQTTRGTYYDQQSTSRGAGLLTPSSPRRNLEKAWVKRQWSKEYRFEKTYFFRETGLPARVLVDEGERDLDSALYRELPPEEQEQLVAVDKRIEELWESVAVNHQLVENHLSPFDKSNGGHGLYPFSFFQYETLPDEPRSRGEISFLISVQDMINEAVTQLLEQLFLNNVGFWHVFKGSLPPEEREKFNRLFYQPHQVIESFQGSGAPSHQGVDPGGLQAAANMIPILKDIADKVSGIHDVDRGQVPGHIESGRAIRALQAKTSRLSIKIRRHIESGLRRATLLRLHNISQFMRGPRLIEVTEPGMEQGKMLYMGNDPMEVIGYYELQPQPGQDDKIEWVNQEGQPVEIMVLNDEVVRDIVFERVKLTLDTGQEANRLERMDQAEMVLQAVGPAAIPWAAKELDWSNRDELLEAIAQRDEAMQIIQMAEQFQKETSMSIQDAMEIVRNSMRGGGQGVPQGAPQGAPPQAPAGMPQPPAPERMRA